MLFNRFNKVIKILNLSTLNQTKYFVTYKHNGSKLSSLLIVNKRYQTTEGGESQSKQEQQQQTFDSESVRVKILENALKYVSELGFSSEAIGQGAIEAGYSAAAKGMLKNGAFDLIDYFYKKSNSDTAAYLENLMKEGKIKRKNELIRLAIIHRLSLIQPYIKHWPDAMANQTFNPSNAIVSIENLLRLCDEIWYQCGDQSTDFNWYTKRLTLAAIYKSTEFFMIQDKSENFKDTIQFLDNRLNDLANFNFVSNELSNVKQGIMGSFTVLKNILGIRS